MAMALLHLQFLSVLLLLHVLNLSGFVLLRNCNFNFEQGDFRNHLRLVDLNQLNCVNAENLLEVAKSELHLSGVTLKMAFDTSYAVADGSDLKSERFTCPQSLDMVHKLRRWCGAVLVGRRTVQRDNCTLTVRRVSLLPNSDNQPARVVIDPSLKIINDDKQYAMFKDGHEVLVYHTMGSSEKNSYSDNVKLINVSQDGGFLSIAEILSDLNARGIHHVMVEGGPATARQFLLEKVVDRAILVRAPVTFKEPVQSGMSNSMFYEAGLELIKTEQCEEDIIEYWSRKGESWPAADGWGNETWPY